uniref:Uncharacterized protein n=1 Tax=Chenopodium quinoa TaxID=63459 RepID=A0A803MJY1_CHEQI
MRVTLFGDQIKAYDEAIAYNGEYKIYNATVRPIDDQYRTTHDQLPYQLHFNHQTVVQPVCAETGYVVPQYQSIASIPKLEVADERYDLCRTRMSGTKNSPVTPAPIGDTKSSLDYDKSTAAKRLRFTTPKKTESKSDEVAEKDPKE